MGVALGAPQTAVPEREWPTGPPRQDQFAFDQSGQRLGRFAQQVPDVAGGDQFDVFVDDVDENG